MHICLIAIKVKAENIWQTIPVVKGDRGESAYEIAVRDGFEGTEEEWLESLSHGPKGNDGAPGNSYQFIFKQTDISQAPVTPDSSTSAVPEGWTASPSGVNAIATYEWVSVRLKTNEVWSVFSTPALWAVYGFGDNLPDIYIEDVIGLQEALNDLTSQLENKISTDLLPEPNTLKLPGADAFGVVLPKFIPIATPTSLGGIKLGGTFSINNEGLANVNLRMSELKEALDETPADGAVIVWDAALGKYKNTLLSITGLFHPLYGKDALNLRADVLRSRTLIIPKTPATPDVTEVALHAVENGYTLENPDIPGVQELSDLSDILFSTQFEGDSLFKVGDNYVNLPAMNKSEIYQLFGGMASGYHPLGGRDYLDFIARDLKSVNLFIPTTPYSSIPEGVTMRAQENGYSLFIPDTFVTEFAQLEDILALTWSDGQGLLYRNGLFSNEPIYNKEEVDTLLDNLNLSDYYDKTYIEAHFHPKYGLIDSVPLDLTADILKSNMLLIPKTRLVPVGNEVAISAIENGYSVMDPSTVQPIESIWDIPGTNRTGISEANKEVFLFNGLNWTNKQLIPTDILGLSELFEETAPTIHNHDDLYYTKLQAGEAFHPKYGLFNHNFKANRLEAKTFIIPNATPLMDTYSAGEVALHAQENGYSIMDPGSVGAGELTDLSDVDVFEPTQHQTLIYSETLGVFVNNILTFDMIPGYLAPTRLALSATYRFVTDTQIASWDAREFASNKNIAGGYLGLNLSRKIDFEFLPDIILGQVKYGGTFNINGIISSPYVALNGENINAISAITYTGYYFISQADVTVVGIPTQTGDWIISNGAAGWAKVDNTDAVTSVNGRIGPITLTKSDVGLSNVDNTADSLKNVLSATKLFTARTLWGQSFDGTSNITGSLADVANITGSGILNMGAILIPKTLYPTIPNNTVAIHAVENGYSIYDPEAGSVGSLDDLSDVDLIARVDKQLLHYNNVTGKFTNGIIDFSYISGNLGADKITQSDFYRFVTATEKSRFQTAYDWGNHAIAGYLTTSVAASTYAAKSTTLSGYGISSTDTMFDGRYLPISYSYEDRRTITPQTYGVNTFQFGFTSNDLANGGAYSDFINFGGYNDSSGGRQNIILFRKDDFGIRQYQGTFRNSSYDYGYVDYLHSSNFTSYADSAGAASTVQGNLTTHIGNTGTQVHGLGTASLRSDTYFALLAGSTSQVFFADRLTATTDVLSPRFYSSKTSDTLGSDSFGLSSWSIRNDVSENFNIDRYQRNIGSWVNTLSLNNTSGAATFSSTVTATGFTEGNVALASKYLLLSGNTMTGSLGFTTLFTAGHNTAVIQGNWEGAGYWGLGSSGGHTIMFDQIAALGGVQGFQGATDITLKLGTRTVYHTGNLTNTLTSGYLPYWNNGSFANAPLFYDISNKMFKMEHIGGTTLRIGNSYDALVSGDLVGSIEFWNNDADTPKIGAYIKSVAREYFGRTGELSFGVSRVANESAVEVARFNEYGNFVCNYQVDIGFGGAIRTELLAVNGSGYFNQHLSIRSVHDGLSQVFIDSSYGTSNNAALRILYDGSVSTLGEVAMLANRNSKWSLIYGNTIGSSLNWGLYIEGNKTNYFGGQVWSATSIKIGSSWEAIPNGTTLEYRYSSTAKIFFGSTGSISAANFYHTSDMRLKNRLYSLSSVMDYVRVMDTFYYTELSDKTNRVQLGMSAQEFDKWFPYLTGRDSRGFLQLDYPRIGVIAIKAIQELDTVQQKQAREIATLKEEVKDLKQKLYGTSN